MLLLIDNYDSFTYNLYQYLCELGAEVEVIRNDKTTIEDIEAMQPEGIVVSPGPCTPREAGISNDVIRHFGPKLPVLGVCLGHQCIGDAYGATVDRAGEIRHGKTSMIHHDGKGVFAGLPNPFEGIRYHSLVIYPETVPDFLEVTNATVRYSKRGSAARRNHIPGWPDSGWPRVSNRWHSNAGSRSGASRRGVSQRNQASRSERIRSLACGRSSS